MKEAPMRFAFAVLIAILPPVAFCQTPSTGKAQTSAPCSPAVSGHHNTFTIQCEVDSTQGKRMVELLNKILENQIDPDKVMAKLDEILKNINPNLPVKTYFCNGIWKSVGPGANIAMHVFIGGDDSIFTKMIGHLNAGQFTEALDLCTAQIQAAPEWLTPRLVCGVAYFRTGDKANAELMLKEFDARTGPAYAVDACKEMSDYLHQKLSQ
jgi:hypothetical protein